MKLIANQILLQAITAHQSGKLEEAESLYRKVLEAQPTNLDANNNLGIILEHYGKLEEAVVSYKKAIELNPDFAEAYNNLGSTLTKLNKFVEAEKNYKKAIELKPDYAQAYYNLGNILKKLDKLDEAKINYKTAIELKPDYAEAFNNLGNISKNLGKFDEAEINYKKAIEQKPDFAEAYYNLGSSQEELVKLDAAEENYKKAVVLNSDYLDAHYLLGLLYKKKGKMTLAASSFYKVLTIKPDYLRIRYHLGSALENEAKFQYRKAYEETTLKVKSLDANLYNKDFIKKNISIDGSAIKHLNKISNAINNLFGVSYKTGSKEKIYAINNGPCGIFANEFYMQWNARFVNQVKIVFIKFKNNNESFHTLIELPNKNLFDGAIGVHDQNTYDSSTIEVSIMEKYNLETLDKNTWGLGITDHPNCPNFSVKEMSLIIKKHIEDLYLEINEPK